MPRRSKWMHLVAGIVAGVTLGVFLILCLRTSSRSIETCPVAAKANVAPDPLAIIDLKSDETIQNSNRTLVFVGVMTAEQYLTSRARAVFETWAQDLPGRLAFFSSEVSRAPGLPLVPLRTVDDSYPPQKKSFMMLLYMYENYGEKFEWYMRADDDVYVRGDKLGQFLRSVDSRKPQFIGQAGRGTNSERDALALDYNENFCMGGPGVLISRETLRRVAPHIKYCLKHLYTTHEDVELGRCVAKFAGVSCTWSYDVSIVAASSCRYVYWQRSSLEYLFVKEPYLACVVTTLIARDITTKLYAMNNKIVTERGSHLDIRLPSISHSLARSPRRLRAVPPPPTTVQPVPSDTRTSYWSRDSVTAATLAKRNGITASYPEDEELIPLAAHEAPAASSDDLSIADSCPDTSSKYHSCEGVETDDDLRH